MNKCFDCQKYSCDNCPELEPDMELMNPETDAPISQKDIDEVFNRR